MCKDKIFPPDIFDRRVFPEDLFPDEVFNPATPPHKLPTKTPTTEKEPDTNEDPSRRV